MVPALVASTKPEKPAEAASNGFETARSAAMKVALMPPVSDEKVRKLILLHAALYHAAYESNVGDFTRHYLLQTIEDPEVASLSIDPAEFRLRVLASLVDIGRAVAWGPDLQTLQPPAERFPASRELATRLRVRLLNRSADGRTVEAEVGDVTANVGSARQNVTATWDGKAWTLRRDGVQVIF